MELNKQQIDAYKELLSNPKKHGLEFKGLNECFNKCEKITAKHKLYKQYIDYLKKPLPKVIFYIIIDEMFFNCVGKDDNGDLGYSIELNVITHGKD